MCTYYRSTMTAGVVALLIAIGTTNCGVQDTLASFQRETDLAAQSIEKEVGVRPTITFNSTNDRLTNLNIVFEGSRVGDMKVSDLGSRVAKVLRPALSHTPETLVVSLSYGASSMSPP